MLAIPFPAIDPVAVTLGPLTIRWYALAYIAGILLGWWHLKRIARQPPQTMDPAAVDDLVVWATLGIVLGGRLGYVLFYKPAYFATHLAEVPFLWQGGMSFHGGLIGVAVALLIFARRRGLGLLMVADAVACVAPIGLFLGRVANFVNGELYGRASDVPWAIVFPTGGPEPRHPSQLYEAGLEGLVLFAVLFALRRSGLRARPGALMGVFLIGYGLGRIVGELFRQPDIHIGFLAGGATFGQLLSVPMVLLGLFFVARARRLQ